MAEETVVMMAVGDSETMITMTAKGDWHPQTKKQGKKWRRKAENHLIEIR